MLCWNPGKPSLQVQSDRLKGAEMTLTLNLDCLILGNMHENSL